MDLEQALHALEAQQRQFQSRIPARASRLRARYLRSVAEDEIEAARKHVQAVYESRLEVGPNFTALPEHANHPKYAFWVEGIRRHLQECEAVFAGQPDARRGDAG